MQVSYTAVTYVLQTIFVDLHATPNAVSRSCLDRAANLAIGRAIMLATAYQNNVRRLCKKMLGVSRKNDGSLWANVRLPMSRKYFCGKKQRKFFCHRKYFCGKKTKVRWSDSSMLPGTECLYKKASSVMSLRECHYPNFPSSNLVDTAFVLQFSNVAMGE